MTETERQEIENLFRKGPNNHVRKRAHAVRLNAMGYTVSQIVEILGCNRQSVYNWFDLFEQKSPQGLCDKPRFVKPQKDYRL